MASDKFQEKLKIGTAGEDIVYPWLMATNDLVQDLRYQKYEKGSGPRLSGIQGSIVLPDFGVWNPISNIGNFLVDVKVKKDIYPVNGKLCFTVDKKFEDYKKCCEIMKMDFLKIIFIFRGKMFEYKDSDMTFTTTYNNQYSKGLVYCFEYDKSKVVI